MLVRRVFETEAFKGSLAALYARRAVAAEFACRGMLNPHADSNEQWLLHDELFYKYKYDVPVPHFNSHAHRGRFVVFLSQICRVQIVLNTMFG